MAIAFVEKATATVAGDASITIAVPTGTVNGHVMVACISAVGGTNLTITPPGGWTLLERDDSTTALAQATYYRIASSEPADYTWSFNLLPAAAGGIMTYSGVDTATPVDASAGQANASGTTVTASGVTTTVADTRLIGNYGTLTSTTFTPDAGQTERFDINNAALSLEGADETVAAIGATGTRAATAGVAAVNIGQSAALRPFNAIAIILKAARSRLRGNAGNPDAKFKTKPKKSNARKRYEATIFNQSGAGSESLAVLLKKWRRRNTFPRKRRPSIHSWHTKHPGLLPGLPPAMECTIDALEALSGEIDLPEAMSAEIDAKENLEGEMKIENCPGRA